MDQPCRRGLTTEATITVWDRITGARARLLPSPIVIGHDLASVEAATLTFSPNGQLLAADGGDGTVWLWRLAEPRLVAHLTGLPGIVGDVA